MNSDKNGNFISYNDALRKVYNTSKVPIYGSWDFFFGKGIVGGMIVSGFNQGVKAGEMALQVINGETISNIPITETGSNKFMFDYTYMKQFGIKINQLPADSILINLPENFFDKYRDQAFFIIGILILMLIILFVYTQYQKRKRQQLEKMNQLLDKRVKDALSDVKILSGLLPICAKCKKIRDDSGYWNQLEAYFAKHSDLDFSHGICPDCAEELYPDFYKKKKEESP